MSEHVTDRLSAYLDDELGGAERRTVRLHLDACPPCSAACEELAALDALAKSAHQQPPAGYFEALPGRVRQQLGGRGTLRTLARPPWTWASAAAAMLLISIVTWRVVERPAPHEPGTSEERAAVASKDRAVPQVLPSAPSAPEPLLDGPRPTPSAKSERTSAAPPPVPPQASQPARAAANEAAPRQDVDPQEADLRKAAEPKLSAAMPVFAEDTDLPEATAARDSRAVSSAERYAATAPAPVGGPRFQQAQQSPPAATEAAAPPVSRIPRADEVAVSEDDARKRAAPASEDRAGGPRAELKQKQAPSAAAKKARGGDAILATLREAKEPTTAAAARALREAWRDVARSHPSAAVVDESLARVVELGALAYTFGADAQDRAQFDHDVAAYLARDDQRYAARVQRARESIRH